MVKRRVVQKGASVARDIAEDAGRKLTGGIKRHTPPKPRERLIGDDWGFTPKPDEITGTKYADVAYDVHDSIGDFDYEDKFLDFMHEYVNPFAKQTKKLINNMPAQNKRSDRYVYDSTSDYIDRNIAEYFGKLESMGVPREYTGMLAKKGFIVPDTDATYLKKVPVSRFDDWADFVSLGLSDNTALLLLNEAKPVQDVAVRLSTNWQGSTNGLVGVARSMVNETKPVQDVAVRLAADWQGSVDELIETARILSGVF